MISSLAIALLAAVPVAVPHVGGSSELNINPFVATNGRTFAVAWDGDTPHVAIYNGRNVVARVERLTNEQAFTEDITAIGNDYVFVYGTTNLLHAAIIGDDGTVRANRDVMPGWTGSVAAIGATAIVVNERGSAALIDAGANVVKKDIAFAPGESYSPDVAASDSQFMVVWLSNGTIAGARIAIDGTASPTVTIGSADVPGFSGDRPSIASNGREFAVAWKIGTNISVANIDAAGMPYAPRVVAIDASGYPSIAWNGSDYVIAYPAGHEIRTVTLAGGRTRVLPRENRQEHPRIAANGEAMFIASEELTACFETWQVLGWTNDREDAFFVSTGVAAQTEASIAAAGGTYGVVFPERGEVWRLRFAAGTAVDLASGFALATIAGGDDEFLVAWIAHDSDCGFELRSMIVRRDGTTSAPRTIAQGVAYVRPTAAWNGSEFLLVWHRGYVAALDAVRIASDGTPIDTTPVGLTVPVEAPDRYTSVAALFASLRWTGAQWQLVWLYSQNTYIPLYPYPLPSIENIRERDISRDLHPVSDERTIKSDVWSPLTSADAPLVVFSDRRGVVAARIDSGDETVVSSEHPQQLTFACSTTECAVGADTRFYRITRDGSRVTESQTLASPIVALASNGSSFLAITIAGNPTQLFAIEPGHVGVRRRSAH